MQIRPRHRDGQRQALGLGQDMQFAALQIQAAKAAVRGDWWDDFTSAKQPLMVVRGSHSPVVPPRHAEEMIRRRPGTEVVTIDGRYDFYSRIRQNWARQ